MGHAEHFLSRLDRLDTRHVELALMLYNDQDLVEELLRAVGLPDGADRVALALDYARGGPFVVLTRTGRFVTCLGPGMHPGDTPVIERDRLDLAVARNDAARARLAVARKLLDDPHANGLLMRLESAGPRWAREDVAPLVVLAPLLAPYFARRYLDVQHQLGQEWKRLHALPLRRRVSGNEVHAYVQKCWATAQLGMLAAESFPTLRKLCGHLQVDLADAFRPELDWLGSSAMCLMAAWCAAKIGPPALTAARSDLFSNGLRAVQGALDLTALGLRRASTTGEVRKALVRAARETDASGVQRALATEGLRVIDDPTRARANQIARGRAAYVRYTNGLEAAGPFRRAQADDVDEALALTFSARLDLSTFTDDAAIQHCFDCLPWLASASLEDLLLPRAVIQATETQWSTTVEESFVSRIRAVGRVTSQARTLPRRHEQCLCASGKKYSKCCGRRRSSDPSPKEPPPGRSGR